AYFERGSENFGSVYWTEDADRLWELIRADEPLPADLLGESINAAAPPGSAPDPTTQPSETPSPGQSPDATESPDPTVSETPSPADEEKAREEAAKAGLCA